MQKLTKHHKIKLVLVLLRLWLIWVMLESKNTDDSIDESDDEDQDSCGVVKDVSSFLILLDIDIKATENQEQCPSYCLKQNIYFVYSTHQAVKSGSRSDTITLLCFCILLFLFLGAKAPLGPLNV